MLAYLSKEKKENSQKTYHNSCEEMKHSGIAVHTLEHLQMNKEDSKYNQGNLSKPGHEIYCIWPDIKGYQKP